MSFTQVNADSLVPNKTERLHYMDNLRALAMLLGIFFHAALAYSPLMHELWMSSSAENSKVLDSIAWFTHLFRMPLFFFIAGFFTLMLLEKRGIKGLIKNRSQRIIAPFIIFLPLVIVAVVGGITWAIGSVENLSPMLQGISYMQNMPDAPQPPISTMHLWFLFNLAWFYVIAILIFKLKAHENKALNWLKTPAFALVLLPLLMVPAMLTQPVPHPAAERIYPEIWSLGFYGLFFLYGLFIYNDQSLIEKIDRYKLVLLILSVGAYSYFQTTMPEKLTFMEAMQFATQGIPLTLERVIQVVLECFIAVYMTLVCVCYGKKFLNTKNKVFRYISDSSYWVYIIHLPVIFFIQYWLLDQDYNLWTEFLISSFGTLIIGFITYSLLVRWTPLGTLLNGKRKPIFSVN